MKLPGKIALVVFLTVFTSVIFSNFLIAPFIRSIAPDFINQPPGFAIEVFLLTLTSVLPATAIAVLILKRSIVKPIISFIQVAKIIASGNLGKRIQIESKDEISELGTNINTIIEHLVSAFQNMAYSLKNEKSKEKQLADSLNQISAEKAKDEALLTSINDAVVAVDKEGRVILFNNAAAKLTGFSFNEALNNQYINILKIINEKGGTTEDIVKYAFLGILNHKVQHLAIVSKNGVQIPISQSIGPIFDSARKISGVVIVLRDTTKERELEKIKDEFLSIASHELRTPMSAIKNLISMIFEGDYGEVNQNLKEPLTDIGSSTERLIQLVNDMLDVSRIESGRLKLALEDVNIKEITEEVVRSMQPLVQQGRVKLVMENVEDALVRTDPGKVKEVLNNLIGNAVKFTDAGQITVSSKRAEGLICISVTDTGVGISKEDQPKLFAKFSQINTDQFVRPAGTGLGLYISREFTRKLGGDLWIESSEAGGGSTFTFSLPIQFSGFAQS